MVAVRNIGLILSLLSAYFTWAQKPYVEIFVEPGCVEVGEQFNVIVKSNVSGEININFPEAFEQGFNVMNRMEQDFDGNTGEMVTFFFHGRSGSLNREGKFTFGPAYITKGKKVYSSNKITVKAKAESTSENPELNILQLRKPAVGVIEVSKNTVYAGEALVVNSKIISQFKPSHYDSYRSFTFSPTIDVHDLETGLQPTVNVVRYGNQERYSFENDKAVVFASATGKVKIEPFIMTLQSGFEGYEVRSRKNHFTVLPLPKGAPKDFTGGVGNFYLSSNLDGSSYKQGEMVTFTLTISGAGNLHDISKPKVNFGDDFKLYGDPKVIEKFSFTENGAEGSIQIVYHLQAVKSGKLQLPRISMSYFDPNTEKYTSTDLKSTTVEVEKDPNFIVQNTAEVNTGEIQIDRFNDEKSAGKGIFSSTTAKWVGVSTPIVLAFLFLMFRKKKEENDEPKITKTAVEPDLAPKIQSEEFLSVLAAHANNGNDLAFFTQLSKDLQKSVSQAAKNDVDWVLSLEERKQYFEIKGFSQEFQKDYFNLQQTCELCRYGCQIPDRDLHFYLDQAKDIFTTLEV